MQNTNRANCDKNSSRASDFRVRRILEVEVEEIVVSAGGARAHPDSDKRKLKGADFVIGSSVIELKILEDEGLEKPERQQKLAKLFGEKFPTRPTVVLDRALLDEQGQRAYDRIFEGPVKSAVSSARQQLQQSRIEHCAKSAVLWVVNNGYSSLSHSALMDLVARRARNDSSEIDAVIVSGAYFYSDTFDNIFFWPIDCTLIHPENYSLDFDALQGAWNGFVMDRMNELVRKSPTFQGSKGPVVDVSFKVDGVQYVMPTPPMGQDSKFFTHGRSRRNSTGITSSPPLATVFAGLSRKEWFKFKRKHAFMVASVDYQGWMEKEARARVESTLDLFITVPVTYSGWEKWARRQPQEASVSVHRYASDIFQINILNIINNAKNRSGLSVLPSRYMLLITEEIGQDLAFDVSHLAEIYVHPDGVEKLSEVFIDRAMFFEQALAVAAAEAISRGVECVLWEKNLTYAWV